MGTPDEEATACKEQRELSSSRGRPVGVHDARPPPAGNDCDVKYSVSRNHGFAPPSTLSQRSFLFRASKRGADCRSASRTPTPAVVRLPQPGEIEKACIRTSLHRLHQFRSGREDPHQGGLLYRETPRASNIQSSASSTYSPALVRSEPAADRDRLPAQTAGNALHTPRGQRNHHPAMLCSQQAV